MILHIENTNESQVAQVAKTPPAMHVEGNRRNSYEKSCQLVIEFTA